jgi:TPR repeat protein
MDTSMIRRLRIAAESGEAAAQFNLGVLYDSRLDDNGYAIKGDRAEAIKWVTGGR